MPVDTRNLPVNRLMQKDVISVCEDQSIFDASTLMTINKIGSLPVVKKDGTFVGMLTDRDIVVKCNYYRKDVCQTKVSECMSTNPYKTVPEMTCENVMYLMGNFGVRRLPVVKNGKLVGIISTSDIARVSNFCPNEKCPKDDCILIDMANELKSTSHLSSAIYD